MHGTENYFDVDCQRGNQLQTAAAVGVGQAVVFLGLG